ncbi:lipopolysaccharide biosynthesis protein [Winogradskyella vincentii]|uniref:Lipopolysaccharide biosynthesis protein n=1 Tax=Winogradskyella vincentii TaxID=2877122 RepID=A0ABS7XZN8_9FLAO|nr:lipopolysaccharide biosynthesis protein [Winogradskyella vincentii]MCA0151877.1 lipopolysaccharide biosynthesis protein [Winogradskyella vincentii]
MSRSLKHYSWSAIQKLGTQIISFIGNVLIARQLSPDDYGLIAMLAIFMSIAMNFTESGFADYLIRDANATSKEFSIVFVHNLVFGVMFFLLLFSLAPLIAKFYERQEIIEITRVLALNIILKALYLSEFTRMRKELEFKKLAIIQIISAALSVSIGFTMALDGWGYWALVAQILSMSFVSIIMIFVLNNWKPELYFDWNSYKVMRRFGNNMLISYFTNQIGANLYSVIIGKVYSSAILGFYNQAEKINKIGFQSINGVLLTTSYSLLAKEQDKTKRRGMYITLLSHFVFVHLTISALLITVAHPFIGLVFGVNWLPTVPFLKLILLSFIMQPLVTVNANIIKIENKPQLYRNLTFLRNGLMFIALVFTFNYGVSTMIIGQIGARVVSALADVLICGKYVGLFPKLQLSIFIKQLAVPFISFALAYFSLLRLEPDSFFMKLFVSAIVYLVSLIILNLVLKNNTFIGILEKLNLLNRKIYE